MLVSCAAWDVVADDPVGTLPGIGEAPMGFTPPPGGPISPADGFTIGACPATAGPSYREGRP